VHFFDEVGWLRLRLRRGSLSDERDEQRATGENGD
jgi:hypothetical protein